MGYELPSKNVEGQVFVNDKVPRKFNEIDLT